jgi:hypothetical protein
VPGEPAGGRTDRREVSGAFVPFCASWMLAVAGRRVDHQRMLPDLSCYEERYRLTGRAALGWPPVCFRLAWASCGTRR